MKRFQSIGALLFGITILLAVVLVSTFTVSALGAYQREEEARIVLSVVTGARTLMSPMIALRSETAVANLALEAPETATAATVITLRQLHARTGQALDLALQEIARRPFGDAKPRSGLLIRASGAYRALFPRVATAIQRPRARRDSTLFDEWKAATTLLSRQLAMQSTLLGEHMPSTARSIDHMMKVSNNAWNMRLDAGRDRGYMQTAVIDNEVPDLALQRLLAETKGKIDARWADIEAVAQHFSIPPKLRRVIAVARKVYFTDYRGLRDRMLNRLTNGEKVQTSGRDWVETSNPSLSSILAVSALALNLAEANAKQQVLSAQRSFFLAIALMVLSLGLACFTGLYALWRVVRPLKIITQSIQSVTAGDLTRAIPFGNRKDEIGQFAYALQLFREGAIERQALQTELVRNLAAKEAAEKSNRVKSEFLANMSHELRTPLNAIIGFSDMIASEVLGPGAPRYREYAGDINGAGLHLLALINDILDISKAEAGKLELSVEPVDLEALIKECARLMRVRAAQQDLHMTLGLTPLPQLLVDRLRVKQIVLNLLSNAIKFTPTGGTVSVEAEPGASGSVVICVRDTGIGISPEMIPLAFEPFRQVDSALSRKFEGTGLGLPLVKTFVELHGGTVRMESALGNGTAVFITLPASCCPDSGAVRAA